MPPKEFNPCTSYPGQPPLQPGGTFHTLTFPWQAKRVETRCLSSPLSRTRHGGKCTHELHGPCRSCLPC
jgi:hypothetical protein